MSVTCISYTPRSLGGRADLALDLANGVTFDIRGWSIYVADGVRCVNPPTVSHGGGVASIMRVRDRQQRELFRAEVLAAVDAYVKEHEDDAREPVAA